MQAPEVKENNKDIKFQSGLKINSSSVNNGGNNMNKKSGRLAGVKSSRSSARNRGDIRDPRAANGGGGAGGFQEDQT